MTGNHQDTTDNRTLGSAELKRCAAHYADRPEVNAYINVDLERAEREAATQRKGPLTEYVLAIKDNIHVAGLPSTAGTAALRNFIPQRSSPVVRKLQDAGAIIFGKAAMHELAYGITSDNAAFGPVLNPLNPLFTAGGSSGGSAAAVASGQATAALGTDTGGSVRLPAAHTGLVGFRPTTGRYSGEGTLQISDTRDTIGLISQNVDDALLLDNVITGSRRKAAPINLADLRIGVPRKHFFESLDPEVSDLAERYLERLARAGVQLVEADLSDVPELNAKVGFPIVLFETARLLPLYLESNATGVSLETLIAGIRSPDVAESIAAAFGGAVTEDVYTAARWQHRPQLQDAYAEYFARHRVDAVIFPTSPILPRPIDGIGDGVFVDGEKLDTFTTYIRNTDPASNAGLPAISIPAGKSSQGLPVGIELDGRIGDDARILDIAKALERVG